MAFEDIVNRRAAIDLGDGRVVTTAPLTKRILRVAKRVSNAQRAGKSPAWADVAELMAWAAQGDEDGPHD